MYNDPFGEICERIMTVITCLMLMIALGVYCLFTEIQYRCIKLYFATWRFYNNVRCFIRLKWNHLYWTHIYEHLYLCGLQPALTDEYVESRRDRLRASIEAKQYCTDPNVQTVIARARAVLQEQEQ
jgi:hypothetical protein